MIRLTLSPCGRGQGEGRGNVAAKVSLLKWQNLFWLIGLCVWSSVAQAADSVSERIAELTARVASYQAIGYYPEAKKQLDQAQALLTDRAAAIDQVRLLAAWGDWLLNSHQEDEAIKKLLEGVRQIDATPELQPQQLLKGQLLNNIGNAYMVQKRYSRADASYQQALQTVAGLDGRLLLEAEIHHNQARAAMRKREFARAASELDTAATLYRAVPDQKMRGFGLVSLGRIALDVRRADPAVNQHLVQAWQLLTAGGELARQSGDDRTLSYALGYQGQGYELDGRLGEAIQLTRQALFHAHAAQ
ncbi:MAG: hypothetical protein HQL58_13280, partial [Magnetococcales bacterium]|nr:hypothetical protein [Magnetococcales bacterium]